MLIIGEKLNSTIPKVRKAIKEKDEAFVHELAQKQTEAGADLLDINTAMEDEVNDMQWIVETVQQVVNTPLCIDSQSQSHRKGIGNRSGKGDDQLHLYGESTSGRDASAGPGCQV